MNLHINEETPLDLVKLFGLSEKILACTSDKNQGFSYLAIITVDLKPTSIWNRYSQR